MFLLAQDQLDQKAVMGDGLDLNLPMTLGCLWAIFCTDLVQDLEYQVRPYEVRAGPDRRRWCKESVELPLRGLPQPAADGVLTKSVALAPHHAVLRAGACARCTGSSPTIEVDRLRVKPKVKITGEFYLQTVEGDPNYNIHRWLEAEGAEVYPAAITVWMDYLLRLGLQRFEDYSGIEKRRPPQAGRSAARPRRIYRVHRSTACAAPWATCRTRCPNQLELRRLAAPYFHSRLDGGEGDMLVGKALWAHQKKKAHMICELSPYSCMPNTMSIGAMAGVDRQVSRDLLYAPLEIKGDAEVHALSRCQMILTEAKKRAQREFDEALARTGLTLDEVRAYLRRAPGDEAGDLPDPARRHRRRHRGQRLVLHVARQRTGHGPSAAGRDEADRRHRRRLHHRQGGGGGGRHASPGRTTSATTPARPRRSLEFLERMETEAGLTAGARPRLLHRLGRRLPRAAGRRPSSSRRSSPSPPASSGCTRTCGSCPRSAART